MKDFSHIDTWVFDLDNTLYSATSQVFPRIHERMASFICDRFEISVDEAQTMRRTFFEQHGTTLRGLMLEHDVPPEDFLHYVHDIEISDVESCPVIRTALEKLPGRKLIYTNGSVHHAENITTHLDIGHHFDGIFDIIAADYLPKPDPAPYKLFTELHDVNPASTCMVEDMAVNLKPAADMGMTTIWLNDGSEVGGGHGPHVHHTAPSLADWFRQNMTLDIDFEEHDNDASTSAA